MQEAMNKQKQLLFNAFDKELFELRNQVHLIKKQKDKEEKVMEKISSIMVRQELDNYHPFLNFEPAPQNESRVEELAEQSPQIISPDSKLKDEIKDVLFATKASKN